MSTVLINGVEVQGNNITIMNGKVIVDGVNQVIEVKDKVLVEVKEGSRLENLVVYGDLNCTEVEGDVECMGTVKCADVLGNVDSNGSVTCETVHGNIDANGSVKIGKYE